MAHDIPPNLHAQRGGEGRPHGGPRGARHDRRLGLLQQGVGDCAGRDDDALHLRHQPARDRERRPNGDGTHGRDLCHPPHGVRLDGPRRRDVDDERDGGRGASEAHLRLRLARAQGAHHGREGERHDRRVLRRRAHYHDHVSDWSDQRTDDRRVRAHRLHYRNGVGRGVLLICRGDGRPADDGDPLWCS